jgi:hypothetical protein
MESNVNDEIFDLNEEKEKLLFSKLSIVFQEYFLSDIQQMAAFKFIKDAFTKPEFEKSGMRVKKWILMKINNKSLPEIYDKNQLGCPDIVPGLTITNFWDPFKLDWVNELISNLDVIKDELISLREEKGFQPYKSETSATQIKVYIVLNKSDDNLGSKANDSGIWNVFYLFLHNIKFEDNCAKCPKTVELIEKVVPRQY